MLISIIVPVYNVKEYLVKCLKSIEQQTFDDYEVVVVDDGSTDGSEKLVDDYCAGKKQFRVFHKENGGLMSAWMYGLQRAIGDYIGFVDSDDFVEINMFSDLYEKAKEYKADIVLCNHYYDKESVLIEHRNPLQAGYYDEQKLESIRNKMIPRLGYDYISPSRCSKIVKKELIFNNLKYCDLRITSGEDVNIMVPCMLSCKSFYYIDKTFYHYVFRNTSISNVFKEELLAKYLILINRLEEAIKDNGLEKSIDCKTLYDVYGNLWCTYVRKSKLTLREKSQQIKRITANKKFQSIEVKTKKYPGVTAKIYHLTIKMKNPYIYLIGMKCADLLRVCLTKLKFLV